MCLKSGMRYPFTRTDIGYLTDLLRIQGSLPVFSRCGTNQYRTGAQKISGVYVLPHRNLAFGRTMMGVGVFCSVRRYAQNPCWILFAYPPYHFEFHINLSNVPALKIWGRDTFKMISLLISLCYSNCGRA